MLAHKMLSSWMFYESSLLATICFCLLLHLMKMRKGSPMDIDIISFTPCWPAILSLDKRWHLLYNAFNKGINKGIVKINQNQK
jgi:hypothetical protein